MHPDIPDPIKPLLQAYLTQGEQRLPGLMAGVYLHGSIVLGAFHPGFSVISRRCTACVWCVVRAVEAFRFLQYI